MNITIRQPAARGSDEFSGVTPMQDTNPSPSSSNSHFAAEEWAIAQRFQYQFAPSIHLNGRRFCKVSRDVVAQGAPLDCDVEALDTGQIISRLLETGVAKPDSGCRVTLISKLGTISGEKAANGLVEFLASPFGSEHGFAFNTLVVMPFIDEKIKVDGCRNLLRHGEIRTSLWAMKYLKRLKGPAADNLLEKIARSSSLPVLAPIIPLDNSAPTKSTEKEEIIYPEQVIELAREELEKRRKEQPEQWRKKAEIEKAIEENPTDPDAHYAKGQYYYDRRDCELANIAFKDVIQLIKELKLKSGHYNKEEAHCHYYMAVCLYQAGRYEEALKQLDEIYIEFVELNKQAGRLRTIIEREVKELESKKQPSGKSKTGEKDTLNGQ